jgi:hypothetical protein
MDLVSLYEQHAEECVRSAEKIDNPGAPRGAAQDRRGMETGCSGAAVGPTEPKKEGLYANSILYRRS